MPPLVSSIPQPPFGSSPMARPSGNPGAAANGVAMVHQAVDMLEKALADLPVGHPIHKAVLTAISNLSKNAPPQAASPGIGRQALIQMAGQAQQQSPLAALMAGMHGGGGGAPGGAPPAGAGGPPPSPAPSPAAGGAI